MSSDAPLDTRAKAQRSNASTGPAWSRYACRRGEFQHQGDRRCLLGDRLRHFAQFSNRLNLPLVWWTTGRSITTNEALNAVGTTGSPGKWKTGEIPDENSPKGTSPVHPRESTLVYSLPPEGTFLR